MYKILLKKRKKKVLKKNFTERINKTEDLWNFLKSLKLANKSFG